MGLYQKTKFKRIALLILLLSAIPVGVFSFMYVDNQGFGSLEIKILVSALVFIILMTIAYTLVRFIYWTLDGLSEKEE